MLLSQLMLVNRRPQKKNHCLCKHLIAPEGIAVFRQRRPSAQPPFVQGSPTKVDSLNTTISLHFSRCHPQSPFDGKSIEGRQNDALQTPSRLPSLHEFQCEYGVDLRDDLPTQLRGRKKQKGKIILTKRIC